MSSIFTKIIKGELPCYKILENDLVISFLTIAPIQLGHALVIPKKEIDHWLDVDNESYFEVYRQAKTIGTAIQKATNSPRVAKGVIGLEVPHFHLHLVPMWDHDDLNFKKAKSRSDEEMRSIHEKIMSHL